MGKTQPWAGVALVAALLIGLGGCASEPTVEREPWSGEDGDFDIFAFVESDAVGQDTVAEAPAREEPEPREDVETEPVAMADADAGPRREAAAVLAVPDITQLDIRDFDPPAADSAAEATAVGEETGEAAPPAAETVALEPLEETEETQSLVVGEDLVVHVVPAPQPPRPGERTVTLANCRSAPVPDSVFESIKARLEKNGFSVAGSAYGDYLVVCGRIPPRTMAGRGAPVAGTPDASFVRATSLAEPLRVPMTRPDGGTWEAIVEIAFAGADAGHLRLRELHTICSGDIRQVRRRDPVSLRRLDETLDAWAASDGNGFARR